MSTFIEYTERYSAIVDGLPADVRDPRAHVDLAALDDEKRLHILGVMRRYFNMCSEEYFLAQEGFLYGAVWEIWKTGIRDMATYPFFDDTWRALRQEYSLYPDFQDLIRDLLVEVEVGTVQQPA